MNDCENLTFAYLGTWNTINCCFVSEILQVSDEIAGCKPLAGIEPHLEKFSSVDITERKMWPTWKEILKDYGLVFRCPRDSFSIPCTHIVWAGQV